MAAQHGDQQIAVPLSECIERLSCSARSAVGCPLHDAIYIGWSIGRPSNPPETRPELLVVEEVKSRPRHSEPGPMLRLSFIIVILALPLQSAAQTITGVASVIDGDTIEIRNHRIRLHGIDAPESRQLCFDAANERWRCGQRATFALADEIGRAPVECTVRGTDRYDRAIAVCAQAGQDLNAWIVRQGWAVAYRRYSRDYVRAEEEARRNRRNLWAGRFNMPWDWRRAQGGG